MFARGSVFIVALLPACVGQIDIDEPGATGSAPGETRAPDDQWAPVAGSGAAPSSCQARRAVNPTPLARLTKTQFQNSLRDLLGAPAYAQLGDATNRLPDDDLSHVLTAGVDPFSSLHLGLLYGIAKQAGSVLSSDPGSLMRFAQPCLLAASAPTKECIADFVGRFAEKAFRRPPTPEQRDALGALFAAAGDARAGVRVTVAAVLQSPLFLYRVENGTTKSDYAPDAIELDSFEIAARLSYGLWDTMPDDALFDVARKGDLRKPEVLQQQVERMIADARSRPRLQQFFQTWLRLDAMPAITTDKKRLAGADPVKLQADMADEIGRFIDYVVWERKGNAGELFTSTASFARSPALASLYGHAPAAGNGPAEAGQGRRGLLMKAPLLLASDGESHPILRGAFIRTQVLCEELAPPSANVAAQGPDVETLDMRKMYSTRERVALKTADPVCNACHARINPAGFPLEAFDGVGAWRTTETVYDAKGAVVAQHPIDPRVDLASLDGMDVAVGSPGELAARLGASDAVAGCVSRKLFRFYQARADSDADACVLDGMRTAAGPGGSLLRALAGAFANRQTTLVKTP